MVKGKFFILLTVWIYIFSVATTDEESSCSHSSEYMLIDSTDAAEIISGINNLKKLFEDSELFVNVKTRYLSSKYMKPMDCAEIQEIAPQAKSGIHKIWPRGRVTEEPISVYCDMDDDGGAWTVIQRRGDFNKSADYFYRDWESYKLGFGNPEEDHWIGNDNIFALTNHRNTIVKFTLSDWEGNTTFAMYNEFWIEDESQKYTIHVSGYTGTAGDSFSGSNNAMFSTKDQDNDKVDTNCAVAYKGGWWFYRSGCYYSHLNGLYLKGLSSNYGVDWHNFRGFKYSLKDTIIKIRPKYIKRN